MQKKEKASITLSLHQEIEREAQEIEKEIAQHPELDQIRVTEEMDKALFEKIRAYEKDVEFSDELIPDVDEIMKRRSGQDKTYADEDGNRKVVYQRKKGKYWIVSLAAVLLIVLGVGMNSVGSKSYWKRLREIFIDEKPVNITNVDDMNEQDTEDINELVAYREINEKLNITPARLFYKPDDMKLVDYEIQDEILSAQLLYKYQGEIIRYIFYGGDVDSSWGQKQVDNKINEYTVSVNEIEIIVEEFQVKNTLENRQSAKFLYEGVHYQLIGIMEKAEFEKILENLYLF